MAEIEKQIDRIFDEGRSQINRDYFPLFYRWLENTYAKGKTLDELKKADGRDVANCFIQNLD